MQPVVNCEMSEVISSAGRSHSLGVCENAEKLVRMNKKANFFMTVDSNQRFGLEIHCLEQD